MNKAMMLYLFLFLVPLSIEDGKKNEMNQDIVSLALDLIKLIGDSNGLKEAISGIDSTTGKNLTSSERLSSILNAFPFEKYSKNGKRFLQAAEKARKLGKITKALYLAKSAVRTYKKAKSGIQKVVGAYKETKAVENGIKSGIQKVEGVYTKTKAVENDIKSGIKIVDGAYTKTKAVENDIKNGIKKVEGAYTKAKAVENGIKSGIQKVEGVYTKAKAVENGIKSGIQKVEGVYTKAKAVENGIKSGIQKVGKAAKFLVKK